MHSGYKCAFKHYISLHIFSQLQEIDEPIHLQQKIKIAFLAEVLEYADCTSAER